MPRIRTLVIILAGGAGGRLELLTHSRAKPAVPFAGTHRLIDFPLSNCLHAGIEDVWVSQQFQPDVQTPSIPAWRQLESGKSISRCVPAHRTEIGRAHGWTPVT